MTRSHSNFAVFILTHGRPNNVVTIDTLNRLGYTGAIYLIVDNEDDTVDQYRENFGAERVIMFDKAAIADTFDTASTESNRGVTVYARNACLEIAKQLELDYFLQLDDDYKSFRYRWIEGDAIKDHAIRNLDAAIEATLTFLDDSDATCVAWSQGGDHMGGAKNGSLLRLKLFRKAMNSFFCRTDRPIEFVGRLNDDVNTYIVRGSRGVLFLTIMQLMLIQPPTQTGEGGMTGIYLDSGTYVKSFYTVMMAPSCVTVRNMGSAHRRAHHRVNWDCAVPKILSSKYREPASEIGNGAPDGVAVAD